MKSSVGQFRFWAIGLASVWLTLFVFFPNLLVIFTSFLTRDPQATVSLPVNVDSYVRTLDFLYLKVLWDSLRMSLLAMVFCLLVGYPFAMAIASLPKRWQPVILFLVILPFWTNSLVRTYAIKVLLAGNGYLGGLSRPVAARVMPINNFIVATEPLGDRAKDILSEPVAVADTKFVVNYWRLSEDNRLLFGGACHYSGRDPKDIAAYMRPKMLKVFPQLADVRIDYQWGGMIGIGANRLPQIGRLRDRPNVYYAQAYAGHGLNATHLAGRLLGEAISGQQSGRFDLFAKVPHITFPGGKHLRSPLLALGMLWHRLKELV